MMRAIDKGLAASKIGLVLVTPALLAALPREDVADKELSTLLRGNRLVPIVRGTTYTALNDVSPMLASRSGLDTSEDTMAAIATKIAELVAIWSREAIRHRLGELQCPNEGSKPGLGERSHSTSESERPQPVEAV